MDASVPDNNSTPFSWSPLSLLVLIGATALAYSNSLGCSFVFDDLGNITANPSLRHLWPLSGVLAPFHGSGLTVSGRPILNLSFALNYAISETRVWSYHALNIAIHCAGAVALEGIVRGTLVRMNWKMARESAFAVALLWALHPLQTEAVTYVSQRAESLMGLFFLLSLYSLIRATAPVRNSDAAGAARWLVLSWLSSLGAMMTKEVGGVLPLILVFYDRTFLSASFRDAIKARGLYYLAILANAAVLLILWGSTGSRGATVGFHSGVSPVSYGFTQCHAIILYVLRTLWPNPLIFDYGKALEMRFGDVLPEAIVLALVIGTIFAAIATPNSEVNRNGVENRRALGFLGASFFIILAPTSSVVPIATQTIAEHRMYLPLATVVCAIVLPTFALWGRRVVVAWLVVACLLGSLTFLRNRDYRSALTLWSDTVAKAPGNARAHYSLALVLSQIPSGEGKAIEQCREALVLDPTDPEAHYNLAVELSKDPTLYDEALAHYREALRLRPGYTRARFNLATQLTQRAQTRLDAIGEFETLLREDSKSAQAWRGLAKALADVGSHDNDAVKAFARALELEPGDAQTHQNFAVLLARIPGRESEATSHYETALRIEPGSALTHYDFAALLSRVSGRERESLEHYREAVRLKPDFVEAHVNLGVAYAKKGDLDAAILQLEAAVRLNPNLTAVREALYSLRQARGH